jgi:type IV secretion system protein VirB10
VSLFRRMRRGSRPQLPEDARGEDGLSPDTVAGERGISSVNRPPPLQSRLSNLLAVGLMSTLAIGFMGWYYSHALLNRKAAAKAAQGAPKAQGQGEMTLPPLGRVDPPKPQAPPAPVPSALESAIGPAPAEPPPMGAGAPPLGTSPTPYAAYGTPQTLPKTPAELALERRLGGHVFTGPNAAGGPAENLQVASGESARATPVAAAERPTEAGALGTLLRPTVSSSVDANVLPTQRLLLPKGAFLDCTLETAIDSTLPGMTTCVLATDTFSVDGSVVLLERGTKLVGETRGQVQQGSARVFVLWTEARTPTGVIVPLASPGADELGRSGLPGEVNRHFWERFGAAILVSVIEGGVQAGVQSRSNSGGTVIYNPSATTDVMSEVLKSTIAIAPTVTKANGDRIQVLVARDLDFRSVYELRPAPAAH